MATATLELLPQRTPTTTFAPQINAQTTPLSMADSLPTLNFGFDDLRKRMNAFTLRFDAFIEQGRRRVLEERNQFRMSVAQVQESQATTTRSLSTLRNKSHHHTTTLSSQSAESSEMRSAITHLTSIRDSHLNTIATVHQRLQSTRALVAARKSTARKQAEWAREMATGDMEELGVWEELLGMRVEGVGVQDRVRFVFMFPSISHGEGDGGKAAGPAARRSREAWFELEMPDVAKATAQEYEIVGSEPKLEAEQAERCLRRMNEGSEDLAGFLKGMREVMREATK